MKTLLLGLAALPFLAGVAFAAEPLSDPQMDRVSAGASPIVSTASGCPGCAGGQIFFPSTSTPTFPDLNKELTEFLKSAGFQATLPGLPGKPLP